MKAKLVKYPFDEKKYRWDYKEMGKTFEYKWNESMPKNYETITPYVEAEDYDPEVHSEYKIIDNGEPLGETNSIKDVSPSAIDISPVVMNYVPASAPQFYDHKFAVLLNDRYHEDYDEVDDRVEGTNNLFYYKLDYSNGKARIKFYRTQADVFADGVNMNEVATFTNNFNIEALAGYICNPARMVMNSGYAVPITQPTDCTKTKRNFVWEDSGWHRLMLYGPYNEPLNNPGRGYRDTSRGTTDGLLAVEIKDWNNKYYYCYAQSLFMGLNFYSTRVRNDNKFVNIGSEEFDKQYTILERDNDLSYDFGNTYNYSYGEGKDGIITEGYHTLNPQYNNTPSFCGIDSKEEVYYNFGDIPNYDTYRYLSYNENIKNNYEIVGFYVDGVKQNYIPSHDLVMPVVHSNNNTFLTWSNACLQNVAKLIACYTFDGTTTNIFQSYDGTELTVNQVPQLPQDADIYESLCHFRTEQTANIPFKNIHIEYEVYGDYDYVFKQRVFMCDFNSNFVPGRDWMEPAYSNNQVNKYGWRTYVYNNETYLENACAYWKGTSREDVLNRYTSRVKQDTLSNYDELFSFNSFQYTQNDFHHISSETGPYITWFNNYNYPLSYIQNNVDTEEFNDKLEELYIQYNSNEGIISNGFDYMWYGNLLHPEYEGYGLAIYTKGLYKYGYCYNRLSLTKNTDDWWYGGWFRYSGDFPRDSKYIVNQDEDLWLYETIAVAVNGNNPYVPYTKYLTRYVDPVFSQGWIPTPKANRGEEYDYVVGLGDIDNLLYHLNPICFVDTSSIPLGTFNYYSSVDLDSDKYLTTPKLVLKPNVVLIGDKTENYVEVPDGNDSILQYIPGYAENNEFHAKTLQVNAPCEYEDVENPYNIISVNPDIDLSNVEINDEGYYQLTALDEDGAFYKDGDLYISDEYISILRHASISPVLTKKTIYHGTKNCYVFKANILYGCTDNGFPDEYFYEVLQNAYNAFVYTPNTYDWVEVKNRTWLTFNSYTEAERAARKDGFYFKGTQWNNISSPFAYLNNFLDENGDREIMFRFNVCPSGKYVNAFILNNTFEVEDSKRNTYIESTDVLEDYIHYWDDNLGGLWYFGQGYVLSNDRNAYPDNGTKSGYSYMFVPEYTKFIEYYRTDNLVNVELFEDRYTYSHEDTDLCDRSYEGTTVGDSTGTHEERIPDANWRTYRGLYLGESIPFLHIEEAVVPPSEILGVPQYDKQVNTSDTLKYGTVASASLSFTLNKPVNDCMALNNQLLVLFYDFKNTDEWERLGFFRIDNIEALDEYSTSLLAHDETYKLNKYVDDFLEGYTQSTTLDLFYRDLLDYCGCFYDTHQPIIHNGNISMSNVYHAVKTTGVQVAHYIAILSPGFIHTNIDGDIVLSQYQIANNNITTSDYTNLVYCAYNTDMIDKVKITSNNAVKGESAGSGENVYFLADDPLLSELQATSYFNDLADGILAYYSTIPAYRPATIDFLILPRSLAIGDIVNVTTPKNENYAVVIMRMSITSSGVQVQSFGTQIYPVEAESNSEFVNLINDMGEISGDVSNMMEAQRTMANAIAENAEHISQNTTDISTIITKNTQQDTTLTNHTNAINTLQGYKSTTSNNLATIILSNTLNNVALKGYVDTNDTTTLNSAKAYADSLVGTSMSMKFGTISWSMSSSGTTKSVHCIFIGSNDKRNGIFIPTAYVADDNNKTYMFRVYNNSYYVLYDDGSTTTRVGWFQAYNASFTED